MKKLEFETSKGMFLVNEEGKGISLKEMTEEQASEIVSFEEEYNRSLYGSAKNKLHSLLKSKGIHLYENHIDLDEYLDCNCDICYQQHEDAFNEAEEKTFYNPYIFKL